MDPTANMETTNLRTNCSRRHRQPRNKHISRTNASQSPTVKVFNHIRQKRSIAGCSRAIWTGVVRVANTDRRTTQSRIYIFEELIGMSGRKGNVSGAKEGDSGLSELRKIEREGGRRWFRRFEDEGDGGD
ncbi:hypothetical protein TSUD_364010 [Trifolium subterraneum]|uniref:Uncharacterized protein n=1 Tax=Trifolium subterraneum TaxID=3900 RepID=A0A2Z6NHN6_TRISU|nr:hypothetical protein TSUD_364010 [Trifolium subterraneum]